MSEQKTSAGRGPGIVLFVLLFFISGVGSLIFQVVWERLLKLYFGVTMTSVTLIVGAFMAGMGLGSLIGGRIAAKLKNPILCFAVIELGICLFGAISPQLLISVGQYSAGAPYWAVFLLSFLLLIIPTFLMGVTMPLLSQVLVTKTENAGSIIGALYGLNTLGAALGAVLAGFFLIGQTGLKGGALFASALYALVAAWTFLLAFKKRSSPPAADNARPSGEPAPAPQPSPVSTDPKNTQNIDLTPVKAPWSYPSVLIASFMIGCIGLGYEMLWFRMLNIINKSTVYSFPVMLFIYLSGLAIGSYMWGKRSDRLRNPGSLFWKMEVFAGVIAGASILAALLLLTSPSVLPWLKKTIVTFQRPGPVFGWINNHYVFFKHIFWKQLLIYLAPVVLLIFPAGVIMGGGLPVLDRLAINAPGIAGRKVGDVHLANIVGSVSGTMLVSFVLLPSIGSELTLKTLLALCLIFPFLHFLNIPAAERKEFPRRTSHWSPLLLLVLIFVLPGRGELYRKIYEAGTGMTAITRETGDALLTLSLPAGGAAPRLLWIGGETNSFFPSNGTYERWAMAGAGAAKPARVLIIGLGGGHSARFLSALPNVREIIVVELLPELEPFLSEHLQWMKALRRNPRMRFIADDGRRYLYAHPRETFDMILTDPQRQFTMGHDSLYSREALQLYQKRLNPGGVLCLWRDEDHLTTKTMASVFPHMDVFYNFTVASNQPIFYDKSYMLKSRDLFLALNAADLDPFFKQNTDPDHVLSEFRADRADVLRNEPLTPIITDLTPWLEYYYLARRPIGPKYPPLNPLPEKFTRRLTPPNS